MDAYLEWSIKLSLLMYATSAPGGGIRTDGVVSERGQFRFPLTGQTADEYASAGSVALFAHHGMPITTLSGLRVHRSEGGWMLQNSSAGGEVVDAFALSEPVEASDGLTFAQVTLTQAGSEMFSGYYRAGEAFDALHVVLPNR